MRQANYISAYAFQRVGFKNYIRTGSLRYRKLIVAKKFDVSCKPIIGCFGKRKQINTNPCSW